jgi:hypothetical protein
MKIGNCLNFPPSRLSSVPLACCWICNYILLHQPEQGSKYLGTLVEIMEGKDDSGFVRKYAFFCGKSFVTHINI